MDETPQAQPTHNNDVWRFTAELVRTAVIVGILAYTIRAFVLQPFAVEGLSMYPQFHDKDYLLVDKFSYRVSDPKRGDIIVFKYPKDPTYNYVKRIIALPGETVKIENSKVTIVNPDHPEGFVLDENYVPTDNQTLASPSSSKGEYTVPKNSYFVMGDNRMGSSDSREWGELPSEDITGRVLIRAFPVSRFSLNPHAVYDEN